MYGRLWCVSVSAADISKVQDDEVGDGTTSVVVLSGELLREAEQLVNQKVHPMTIIAGFREAAETARTVLTKSAFNNVSDPALFRQVRVVRGYSAISATQCPTADGALRQMQHGSWQSHHLSVSV